MTERDIRIVEGVADENIDDALRVAYEAFAQKFRIGFRNADDLIRLFQDSLDQTRCYSAEVDGRLLGFLAFKTDSREFFRLNPAAVFARFWPWQAIRILFNLLLLAGRGASPDEFMVDAVAVSEASRGLGLGTALMKRAEDRAREMGKRKMMLQVIGENAGAIRLYERLGFRTVRTQGGFLVRLAAQTSEVRTMEKLLAAQ